MKTYIAHIERYKGDSWLVEFPDLNYGLLHLEVEGGASTLENHIRSVIEEVTDDWEFRVTLVGARDMDHEVVE